MSFFTYIYMYTYTYVLVFHDMPAFCVNGPGAAVLRNVLTVSIAWASTPHTCRVLRKDDSSKDPGLAP